MQLQRHHGKRIETIERFFGSVLADELEPADLVVANNVLPHVPDINDFLLGIFVYSKQMVEQQLSFNIY